MNPEKFLASTYDENNSQPQSSLKGAYDAHEKFSIHGDNLKKRLSALLNEKDLVVFKQEKTCARIVTLKKAIIDAEHRVMDASTQQSTRDSLLHTIHIDQETLILLEKERTQLDSHIALINKTIDSLTVEIRDIESKARAASESINTHWDS